MLTAPEWPGCRGGAGTGACGFQGVKASCPLALAQKLPPDRETKKKRIPGVGATYRREAESQGRWKDPQRKNPQGTTDTWMQG